MVRLGRGEGVEPIRAGGRGGGYKDGGEGAEVIKMGEGQRR